MKNILLLMAAVLVFATCSPNCEKAVDDTLLTKEDMYLEPRVESVEEGLRKGGEVRKITLYNKGLEELPKDLDKLCFLQSIGASGNNLSTIDSKIGQLPNLQYLYLSRNNFYQFPEVVLSMKKLRSLNLSDNHISEVTSDFSDLKRLKELNLSSNPIHGFPTSLYQLNNTLEVLALDNIGLSILPDSISQFSKLRVLSLEKNNLEYIPISALLPLKSLKNLELQGNKFTESYIDSLRVQLPWIDISN